MAQNLGISVCGIPTNIQRFLNKFREQFSHTVISEKSDGDCYSATIALQDNVNLEEVEAYFNEQAETETWHVQTGICEHS